MYIYTYILIYIYTHTHTHIYIYIRIRIVVVIQPLRVVVMLVARGPAIRVVSINFVPG